MSAVESGGRSLGEHPEGWGALGGGEGADDQPRGLMRERLRERRMAVAETRDRDAGKKIDEHVAVDVGERRALAVIERDCGKQRDTLTAGRDMALLLGEQRARFWSRNWSGYFRLKTGPARGSYFVRGRGTVGGPGISNRPGPISGFRSVCDLRSLYDFRSVHYFRSAGRSRRRGLRFAHAAACLRPRGKVWLRSPGAAGARASGSAVQSRGRRPRVPG